MLLMIRTAQGVKVLCVQVAGLIARPDCVLDLAGRSRCTR